MNTCCRPPVVCSASTHYVRSRHVRAALLLPFMHMDMCSSQLCHVPCTKTATCWKHTIVLRALPCPLLESSSFLGHCPWEKPSARPACVERTRLRSFIHLAKNPNLVLHGIAAILIYAFPGAGLPRQCAAGQHCGRALKSWTRMSQLQPAVTSVGIR
jgi:hypothetical protein